jgi:hypothetical protein
MEVLSVVRVKMYPFAHRPGDLIFLAVLRLRKWKYSCGATAKHEVYFLKYSCGATKKIRSGATIFSEVLLW